MFNVTEAARRMRKTRVWLSQRLNGCEVNGKVVEFTNEELHLLFEVLSDMWQELGEELRELGLKIDIGYSFSNIKK